MNSALLRIVNEAISIEVMIHEIYISFSKKHIEDNEFWQELAKEELNHAESIRKIKSFVNHDPSFGAKILELNIEKVLQEKEKVIKIAANISKNSTREEAFKKAIELENKSTEVFYQVIVMKAEGLSEIEKIFKSLTGNDKDHILRIKKYANSKIPGVI